jgi:hypothetical protein
MNRYTLSSFLFLLLWCMPQAWAGDPDSSRLHVPGRDLPVTNILLTEDRSFPEVEQFLTATAMPVIADALFTTDYLNTRFAADTAANMYQLKAQAEFEKLEQSKHYTTTLTPDDLNELPIGLSQQVGNTVVKIAVSSVIFHPGYAELTVYAKLEIPQEPKRIFFGIKGLKLSYTGGIIGDSKLVLLGNIPVNFNGGSSALVLRGGMNMETGQGLDLTYVTIDCAGFKELSIAADVMFPRSLLTPLNANNERVKDATKLVTASFQTTVRDWNDILVSIALPPFEITSLKDFGFHIGKAVFDGSDIRNSNDIVYPSGYAAKYMSAGNETLWRGVYISDLEVILPRQFSKGKNMTQRVSFGARNLIIDNNGITGTLFGQNILPAGSASGWRFSVDKFNLDLEANHLTGAGFNGTIQLPVSSTPLGYTAVITANDEYLLRISALGKLSFDAWAAKAELDPNSWVQLKLADGEFQPEAMLNGRMGISTSGESSDSTKSPIVSFNGIVFNNLHLQTKAPYLTATYFGYKDEAKLSNFPVTLTEIGLSATGTRASLFFGVKVNLMAGSFGGETRVELAGKFEESGGLQTWKFEKLQLNLISINAKIANALTIKGTLLIMRDDPVYGNAISGSVKADFLNDKIKIEARAMFGCKDFRYWYVDAKANLGAGIMVIPPIAIDGFGGGAYYHMKKSGVDMQASPTGVNYVPDENTGLGIKAMVMFNVAKKVANGEVSFEVAFNNSGGVNFMGFYGYATILKVIPGVSNLTDRLADKFQQLADAENAAISKLGGLGDKLQALKVSDPGAAAAALSSDQYRVGETGLSAYVGIQYDFTQSTFHSNFELYLNVAGGLITGTSSGNRAGWAVMHIGPGEWYFHMGTPTNRIGIKFAVGSINIAVGAYLMAGDKIPGSPPPPKAVADILGVDMAELDYMRDLNSLGDGRGFAFGANLSVETGDLTFLILYANFSCGVGFDIMLKDYGDAHCKGSSGPIGMDGWYANGQSYVYLQGEVGVKVNLRFIKGRFPIISGAAAVLMQAKLPNPTWMRGYMGVKFKILGGLVSGNMRMKVVIGSECEIETGANSPIDVKMISDITPAANATDVDVFSVPQVAFNMRIGQSFDVEDDNGVKSYRTKLSSFIVTDNGQPVAGQLKWNENNDAVSFYSKEVFGSKRAMKATARVIFEEYVKGNWQTLYVNGQESVEEETVSFTTGTAPDYIPLQNILYCYPVVDQHNYYVGESQQGFVALDRGQSYLFDSRWKYEVQFAAKSGAIEKKSMHYDSVKQYISFELPVMQQSMDYSFDIVAIPPGKESENEAIVSYASTNNGDDGNFSVKSNKAADGTRGDITKSLLGFAYKSSKYKTFAVRMNDLSLKQAAAGYISSDIIDLRAQIGTHEQFEVADLTGNNYTGYQPLVQPAAVTDDIYFSEDINPVLYKEYPINDVINIGHRDTEILGIVPRKAISVMSGYLAEVAQGAVTSSGFKITLPFVYNLPLLYKQDFMDLQYQVVNRYLGTPEQNKYQRIILGFYPFIRYGKYKVEYQYVLPNGAKGTRAVFEYQNPIR